MNKKALVGNVLLLLTAIIWGTAFAAQRVGMDHIEPFTFGASRYVLATLVLIPIIIFFDGRKKKAPDYVAPTPQEVQEENRQTLKGGILCGMALFIASSFQQIGIQYTSAGKTAFITALYIVLVPVFGLFLKKKVTWLTWLGVALSAVGLYLLCIKEGFTIEMGDFIVFLCSICFAVHILLCDHFTDKANPLKLSFLQFFVCCILSWIAAFAVETPTIAGIAAAGFAIFYCGVFSAGVGYTLQMVAQKDTDPTIASLLMSLESVFGAVGGYFILHEVLSVKELIGCVVMFAAIIVAQIPLPEKKQ